LRRASQFPELPNAAVRWAVIGAATVFALKRTAFGRAIYGVGGRERVADLSGCASKAAQAIGDAYLLPAIAAVALGGISILGGRGGDLDAVAGAMPITPSQSILWATQIAKVGRRFVDGVVIVCMSAL
jgi:ribose transport system permease protein